MITPIEIRNKEFKKNLGGYAKDDVDDFFSMIASEYDALYRDNIALKDKITMLKDAIKEYKSMEAALQQTIVTAQNVAEEVKRTAQLNAESLIKEAEAKSSEIITKAEAQVNMVKAKNAEVEQNYAIYKSKIRTLVEGQLKYLDELE